VKKQSNVRCVEKHSAHPNNSNKNFGTLSKNQLKLIFRFLSKKKRTSGAQQAEKSSIHLGYTCHRCRACPIADKCYRCTTCHDYFLCQTCFNSNVHSEHSFDYREVRDIFIWIVHLNCNLSFSEIISTMESSNSRSFNSITECTTSNFSQSRYYRERL